MGTVAAIAAIDSFAKFGPATRKASGQVFRLLYTFVMLIELLVLARAASRAAMIGFVLCALFLSTCNGAGSR